MKLRFVLAVGLLALLLAGCGGIAGTPAPTPTATQAPSVPVLNFYNWDTYIDPTILSDFERQFNVKINYTTFTSNEELLAAVESGATAYDLIVPSDYTVAIMRRKGLLAPLDKKNIPNFKNVDPIFINPEYDPGNRYCAPYQWGTMGIGYDRAATGRDIRSWRDVFDPAFAGRVALLDDTRISLGAILLYLGYSPNTTNKVELAAARDFLKNHAQHIAVYAPDTGQNLLISDTVDLALEWSGDIFQIMEEHPHIRYVIPEEGSIIWTDNICIPVGAPHKELAEQFINFILDPQVGARLSNFIRYSSPNQAALPFINEDDRRNPALYPPDDIRRRLFFISDVGPDGTRLYNEIWQEVLAGHTQ